MYRCFDATGSLIYVGITSAGIQRFRAHADEQDWWPDVARIEIDHAETREEAEGRESTLIAELNPPFNAVGRSHFGESLT